jgi:hypothetical protein
MIAILFGCFAVCAFVVWRRARKGKAEPGPLAGYDTGVRSPYRTPERFFHNRRGF